MLDSTIWIDRDARELFITALLMAEPMELKEPMKQLHVREIKETGFVVPPGWYGFIPAAGSGIVRRAGMEVESGLSALERLGNPEHESRTPDFEGRRLVRVDGGFIALNFDKYRQKDHTAAERSRRYRERKVKLTTQPTTSNPPILHSKSPTIEEIKLHGAKIGLSDSEAEKFFNYYESNGWKVGRVPMKSWHHALSGWKLRGNGAGGSGMTSAQLILKQKALQRVENRLEFIRGQKPIPVGSPLIAELTDLKSQRQQMMTELGLRV